MTLIFDGLVARSKCRGDTNRFQLNWKPSLSSILEMSKLTVSYDLMGGLECHKFTEPNYWAFGISLAKGA